jgi:hypothetical protein
LSLAAIVFPNQDAFDDANRPPKRDQPPMTALLYGYVTLSNREGDRATAAPLAAAIPALPIVRAACMPPHTGP